MHAVPLTARPGRLTVGVAVAAVAAVVVGALLVGGSLTQSPAAVADAPAGRSSVDLVDPAVRIELPTLGLDG